jgi:hypothetical protein
MGQPRRRLLTFRGQGRGGGDWVEFVVREWIVSALGNLLVVDRYTETRMRKGFEFLIVLGVRGVFGPEKLFTT